MLWLHENWRHLINSKYFEIDSVASLVSIAVLNYLSQPPLASKAIASLISSRWGHIRVDWNIRMNLAVDPTITNCKNFQQRKVSIPNSSLSKLKHVWKEEKHLITSFLHVKKYYLSLPFCFKMPSIGSVPKNYFTKFIVEQFIELNCILEAAIIPKIILLHIKLCLKDRSEILLPTIWLETELKLKKTLLHSRSDTTWNFCIDRWIESRFLVETFWNHACVCV